MTQRLIAACLAVPLVLALLLVAALRPLPYVTYRPGPTVDVLAKADGKEIIQVSGAKTFRDDGQLRMTTVSVTRPRSRINLFEVMAAWASPTKAVYPYDVVYPDNETPEESEAESAVAMVSSQDTAIAVALKELGHDVTPAIEVVGVTKKSPADGNLAVRDVIRKVGGTTITDPNQLVDAIGGSGGRALRFEVLRDGAPKTITVTPAKNADGDYQVGISLGGGYVFPFEVSVNIDPDIGGPSAGLMFSLGIFDTLTPGSLTGGEAVAGTGTIAPDGTVGEIGGIQQKIAGARADGAELFLVPADNCGEAVGARHGDMRLVKATTMHSAVEAIEAWTADPDAKLPSCEAS